MTETATPIPDQEVTPDPDPTIADYNRVPDETPRQSYTTTAMAKALYDDAGIEWPDWIDDPSSNPEDHAVETTPTTEPTEPTPTADPSPTTITIDGREIPIDEAKSLLQFQTWFANNPDKVPGVLAVMRGQQPSPTEPAQPPQQITTPDPQPPQPPEGFDLDTPRDKFLFDRLQQMTAQQENVQRLMESQLQETARMKVQAEFSQALDQFKKKFPDLTDAEVESARQAASELNIVGGLATGRFANDPVAGIVTALETGMWTIPELRTKLTSTNGHPAATPTPDTFRKSKLNSLNPSGSGSAPRTETPIRLDSDQAMKDVIAKAVEPYFNNTNN